MDNAIIPPQFDAFVPTNNIILVSKDVVMSNFNASIRALLLHEIGHIYTYRRYGRIKSEYDAHKWALWYSKKHNMFLEYNELLKLAEWWVEKFNWNKKGESKRTYIIVGKMILKKYKYILEFSKNKKGNNRI